MEGEIGVRVIAKDGAPRVERFQDGPVGRPGAGLEDQVSREVDDRRHATERGRSRGRFGWLRQELGAAPPVLRHGDGDVGVRLDAAGQDDLALGVDDSRGVAW